MRNISESPWFIASNLGYDLKIKIDKLGKPLEDWDININYGIKTGFNKAFIINKEGRDKILNGCSNNEEKIQTENLIKPVLGGGDLMRYYHNWKDLWIIGTFPALSLEIENFPSLRNYLLSNYDIRRLEQSGEKYLSLGFNARKKKQQMV